VHEDLRSELDLMVRGGYQSRDEIIEAIAELAAGEGADLDNAELSKTVDAAIVELRAEARTWPRETDNDRLDRAFARLTAAGVIARQDFACCTSCAHAEIWDEVPDPRDWRGYVWFHRQDTERAVVGDGLYLGFGGRDEQSRLQRLFGGRADGTRADAATIGHEIVQALAGEGLSAAWDGKIDRRILVEPFEWRRPPPD
jgi:uncharacterized protein DUF6891